MGRYVSLSLGRSGPPVYTKSLFSVATLIPKKKQLGPFGRLVAIHERHTNRHTTRDINRTLPQSAKMIERVQYGSEVSRFQVEMEIGFALCYRTVVYPVCLNCGQTAGWIKMPLGTEVGLIPGNIMLGGHISSALFGQCLSWPNVRPSQQLLSSCRTCSLT